MSSWNYKVNQPPFIESLGYSVSCLFVCLFVSLCVCGGVKAEVKIHCLPQSLATLLLRRYLSLNPELTDQARPASQGAQGTTASASPSLGLQMHYHSAWHFYAGGWGGGLNSGPCVCPASNSIKCVISPDTYQLHIVLMSTLERKITE